ncbi:immunoglobulin-binding protein 1-like [Coccinella septempunctata]|uniref:immunoglobulin-binding protein 1-like n=1 Tax=Coccinella septempunctata TaxID=41139 RepID=UPI001D077DC1|nr:immunoglobulin-binding protein 1-like [Coccinella septempunctata]
MAASELSENYGKLREMLDDALKLYNKIEDSSEPTSSEGVQASIRRGIEICEEATRMVSYAGIFSRNEGLSDMATADIQYLLLPVLLGRFTSQLVTRERADLLRITDIYYIDFLQRTKDYGLSNYELDGTDNKEEKKKSDTTSVDDACKFRNMKLKQYGEKKKFLTLVTDLKKRLDNADDSTKREYYINLIKYFVCVAIEELNSNKMEKEILEKMQKHGPTSNIPVKPRPSKAPQAVIITKDMVQKAVFGAGYPSLPTMTVQEFYDKRVHDGIFPDPTKPKKGPMSLQEASLAGLSIDDEKEKENEEEEIRTERDDEEYLRNKRDQDDYKDDHRRGWGNRANRS